MCIIFYNSSFFCVALHFLFLVQEKSHPSLCCLKDCWKSLYLDSPCCSITSLPNHLLNYLILNKIIIIVNHLLHYPLLPSLQSCFQCIDQLQLLLNFWNLLFKSSSFGGSHPMLTAYSPLLLATLWPQTQYLSSKNCQLMKTHWIAISLTMMSRLGCGMNCCSHLHLLVLLLCLFPHIHWNCQSYNHQAWDHSFLASPVNTIQHQESINIWPAYGAIQPTDLSFHGLCCSNWASSQTTKTPVPFVCFFMVVLYYLICASLFGLNFWNCSNTPSPLISSTDKTKHGMHRTCPQIGTYLHKR